MYFSKIKRKHTKIFRCLKILWSKDSALFPFFFIEVTACKKKAKTELCRTPLLGLEPKIAGIEANLLTTRLPITLKTSIFLEVF